MKAFKNIDKYLWVFILTTLITTLPLCLIYENRLATMQSNYDDLQATYEGLQADCSDLQDTYESLQDTYIELRATEKELRDNCFTLQYEIASLNTKLNDLTTSNFIYKTTNSNLQLINDTLNIQLQEYKAVYTDNLKKLETIYPEATTIWIYLTENCGFSNEISAAIMGNIMAECGGQSLYIQPYIYDDGYYGICMWGITGKDYSHKIPLTSTSTLQEQLEWLKADIEYEFNVFGDNYKSGFNYEKFLTMDSVQEAAYAFAVCYERCGSGSYSVRKTNALKAYVTFVKY